MKKILLGLMVLASASAYSNEWNVYTKFGGDIYSRFNKLEFVGKKGNFAPSVFLEGTKNLNPYLELGMGIGYTGRSAYKLNTNIDKYTYKGEFPRYNSIPLYFTAKYNFAPETDIKPYIKADLGWSFNTRKSADFTITDNETNQSVRFGKNYTLNIKDGIYAGIGLGLEFNNIVTEISYVHTGAKVYSNYDKNATWNYKNKAVRLSIGYKFNF